MPLHDYIRQIYKEVNDRSYVIRFLEYLISNTIQSNASYASYASNASYRITFTVNEHTAKILISGILINTKTKERYTSLAQFYNKVTLSNISETDINVFRNINVINNYSIWRIVCNSKEKTILEFFDQKYRSFLMYHDIKYRVKYYASIDINKQIPISWNNNKFIVSESQTKCELNPTMIYTLLTAYEDGNIVGLYYCGKKGNYLITDT